MKTVNEIGLFLSLAILIRD